MNVLPREFYARDTAIVAKELLGKQMVRKLGNTTITGTIIETEAYKHRDDPASHAFNGITDRNKAMFSQVGCAYVYFTYGMHYCVNAVAHSNKREAGAVLIRAIAPGKGIDIMIENRGCKQLKNLTNGPAKLAQAMQIDKKQYGVDLVKRKELFITEGTDTKIKIQASPRVGISKAVDKKWNFKIKI